MTAAFWWYILAGFIVGFSLSTVWEWLYFRKRRMRITDRRIAELEQALRTQARNAAAVEVSPEPGVTWSATEYQSPGVLLENEEDAESLRRTAAPIAGATAYVATTTVRNGHANGFQPTEGGQAGVASLAVDPAPQPVAEAVAAPDTSQADDGLSVGQKAALGLAAGTAVAATANALAAPDAAQQAEAPATSAPDEPKDDGRTGELATAALAGAAVAAILSEDEAADDGAVSMSEPEPVVSAEAAPAADETAGESELAAPAPRSEPPQQAIAEVRGFTARQGYIVSELSPSEFTALQATQKARQAARKAWEQARAVSDYLRNI